MSDKTIYKKHTTYYKSPKIILKYSLDKTYDYWSLGCTIYELITGEIMFDPFNQDIEDIFCEVEDRNLMYLIITVYRYYIYLSENPILYYQ